MSRIIWREELVGYIHNNKGDVTITPYIGKPWCDPDALVEMLKPMITNIEGKACMGGGVFRLKLEYGSIKVRDDCEICGKQLTSQEIADQEIRCDECEWENMRHYREEQELKSR